MTGRCALDSLGLVLFQAQDGYCMYVSIFRMVWAWVRVGALDMLVQLMIVQRSESDLLMFACGLKSGTGRSPSNCSCETSTAATAISCIDDRFMFANIDMAVHSYIYIAQLLAKQHGTRKLLLPSCLVFIVCPLDL